MQTAQMTLKQYGRAGRANPNGSASVLSNWLVRLFGCWHREMSRPFTLEGESYRTCLECGAHRKFDPNRWQTVGDYYYKPAI